MSGELKSRGVWEEALLEELIYAIAHIAHAEQHLLEMETSQGKLVVPDMINALRSCRKDIGGILFDNLQLSGGSGSEFRNVVESFWCFIKHTSMALIHCDEIAEKLIRRLMDSGANDTDKVKAYIANLIDVYKVRKTLRDTLIKLLKEPPENIDASYLVRCREDLCLDSESE